MKRLRKFILMMPIIEKKLLYKMAMLEVIGDGRQKPDRLGIMGNV